MVCPKCNKEMRIDDRDSDYMAFNNLSVLTNRTNWWVCNHCGYNAIQETKIEYFDVNGEKLELDEYIENDEDYNDYRLE